MGLYETVADHHLFDIFVVFLTTYDEFESRLLENIRLNIPGQGITVSLKNSFNQDIISINVVLRVIGENVISSATISRRIGITLNPRMSVETLGHYFSLQDSDLSEEEIRQEIDYFNYNYNVNFSLDGASLGQIKLHTYEKDGKIVPAFAFDYYSGASCF